MITAVQDPDHPVSLERLSAMLSTNAAIRFRLQPEKGEIAMGADADLVIVNLDAADEIKQEVAAVPAPRALALHRTDDARADRRGPFCAAETIYRDGKVIGKPGGGRLLRPAEVAVEAVIEALRAAGMRAAGL